MNIFQKIKQYCLDWWFMTTTGEKFAEVMTVAVIILFILALMYVNGR